MRILVTGAGGYIGMHLVPKLREAGHAVIGTRRFVDGGCGYSCFEHYVDLAEETHIQRMATFMDTPDTVIHLAGRVEINLQPNPKGAHLPPVPGPCDIGALYRDNVLATANVLQYCLQAGVKHLIFASTQAVYGMEKEGCQECGNPAQTPLEYYAASKLAAERLLEMGRKQGLAVTVLRLPGVYGGDRKEGAVYNMCRDAVTGGVVRITVPYPLPINVLHIEDVVAATAAAISCEGNGTGHTLDVTGVEACSLERLAQDIAELTDAHIECTGPPQPLVGFNPMGTVRILNWYPKPRHDRLAQILEEIKHESQKS